MTPHQGQTHIQRETPMHGETPRHGETPSEYAGRLSIIASSINSELKKRQIGQYFTPPEIAGLMSYYAAAPLRPEVHILEPGAGTLLLSCRLIERLLEMQQPENSSMQVTTIYLDCYETDEALEHYALMSLRYLEEWLGNRGVRLHYMLHKEDFIGSFTHVFSSPDSGLKYYYDYVISNPPYYKVENDHPAALAARNVVTGQVNVYSVFLYISAVLLGDEGQLIYLIPRNFCSGRSFREFRERLTGELKITHIHLSANSHSIFPDRGVLDEPVVLTGVKNSDNSDSYPVIIGFSGGTSADEQFSYTYDFDRHTNLIPLAVSEEDLRVFETVHSRPSSLEKQGFTVDAGLLKISDIGKYRCGGTEENAVPVIWQESILQGTFSVNPGRAAGKPQYISAGKDTERFIVPNKNYLLIRRYNEGRAGRRVLAVPYFREYVNSELIAFERKLLYVDRSQGELSRQEILGLSEILNSDETDAYFRIINGNMNVSRQMIREIPLVD